MRVIKKYWHIILTLLSPVILPTLGYLGESFKDNVQDSMLANTSRKNELDNEAILIQFLRKKMERDNNKLYLSDILEGYTFKELNIFNNEIIEILIDLKDKGYVVFNQNKYLDQNTEIILTDKFIKEYR